VEFIDSKRKTHFQFRYKIRFFKVFYCFWKKLLNKRLRSYQHDVGKEGRRLVFY